MQRRVEHKFRNAFAIGIIALLVSFFALVAGKGINAMAIYEDRGALLSSETGTGLGFMIVVTFVSVLFVLFALDFVIAEDKFDEKDEKKLRAFAAMCRGRGYSKEEITTLLTKNGWNKTEIKNYLN